MSKGSLAWEEQTRRALLDYCHLDTLAMVRVWEKLKELAKLKGFLQSIVNQRIIIRLAVFYAAPLMLNFLKNQGVY